MIPEISIGEYGFKKILEDFKYTKNIVIITYNISTKDNGLLGILKEIKDKKIIIITNIPGRWEEYFNAYKQSNKIQLKEKALQKIKIYLEALNPENFKSEIEVYFNFKNHSKIYFTDNYLYIGSQNFSEESKENYEVGIVLKNNIGVKIIENIVQSDLIRYYGLDVEDMKKKLKKNIRDILDIIELIKNETKFLPENISDAGEYVSIINPYLDNLTSNIKRIRNKIQNLKTEIEIYKSKYNSYNLKLFKSIIDLLLVSDKKIEILDKKVNPLKKKCDNILFDEVRLHLIFRNEELGIIVLNDMYNRFKRRSENDIKELCEQIEKVLDYEEFIEIFKQFPKNEKIINNAE